MKNFGKLFGIIALVAVIGFSFVSCSDGGGGSTPKKPDTPAKPTDTWKAVTSLTQLVGTWEVTDTVSGPLDEFPNVNVKSEAKYTITFTSISTTTGKYEMNYNEKLTFSGTGLNDSSWSEIKSSIEESFEDEENFTVASNDSNHTITVTATQEQPITSADDLSDIQINKDGTKIKIIIDYMGGPAIFTKQ